MAILLRSIRTGFFYVGYQRWRAYPDGAFDFQTLEQANDWIQTIQLEGVEIVQVPGGMDCTQKQSGLSAEL